MTVGRVPSIVLARVMSAYGKEPNPPGMCTRKLVVTDSLHTFSVHRRRGSREKVKPTPAIAARHLIREGLETEPASSSVLSHEAHGTDDSLWRGHCRRSRIKDSTPAARGLCEYTWDVVACMVLTG